MPVSFASPHFLLLLVALLPAVWLIGRRSLAGLEPARRRLTLALRLLVVTLLVLALAEVSWRDLTERVEVIFVVDHSRSIPDDQSALALEVINKAKERMDPRQDLGKVVVFGREGLNEATLRQEQAPLTRYASEVDRKHSNLESGLRRALEAFEPGVRGRIVLLSDGNATQGDAEAAIAKARAAKVPVDVVPLEYGYDEEVLVEKVALTNEAKLGEPFPVRVVMQARQRTEANVHLWREGALVETRRVTLEPGTNVEQFQLTLSEPGFFRVEAVIEPIGATKADRLFQNNTSHGFVFARGKAQVLYVHDDADPDAAEAQHLLAALRSEAIRLKVIPAIEFPLDLGELQAYDAVILDDVERSAFSANQQENIERAVADLGLGLIMIGGARSFGAGEWRGSPVERALPVEMDIKQEEVIPDGALVMIMHSCEYPDGNAMAVKVCKKAVDSLSAKDTVGVLVYGPPAQWVVRPIKASNRVAIKQAIHNMSIGDMPDFDEIFRLALAGLKKTNASVKHMIIMSDGDPSAPSPALLKECRDERITVSTICYFAHGGAQGPSVDLMKRIANMTGGKYYYLDDPNQLPRIFLKESQRVARSLIVNKTFTPQVRTRSPVLTGFDSFPPVTGYVLTEPKTPRAEVALVSPDGAPVLAHWQYGVGKALAFTSDAKPRWASSWVAWEGFRQFWAQCVRWVSKDVQEQVFDVSTTLQGDRGQVVLDAITADGVVVEGMNVRARVSSPDPAQPPTEVLLQAKGGGRYEGSFPTAKVGTYSVSLLSLDEQGRRQHSVTTGLVVPYSEEFRALSSDRPALVGLAEKAGGRVLSAKDVTEWTVDPWARDDLAEKVALEERWPLVLTLALALFLLDVALRRVVIDWGKLFARARAVVGGGAAAPRTMERLRARKAEVQDARQETRAKFQADGVDRGSVQVAGDEAAAGSPGGAPVGPRPAARPASPTSPGPGASDEDGGYTNRLLAAKKRARKSVEGAAGDDQRSDGSDGGSGDA